MGSQAKYRKIAQLIERRIVEQRLSPGDSLPSERQLADEMGVAYGTVRLAYDALFRAGLVERHQGRGTFVSDPDKSRSASRRWRLGLLAVEMHGYESPYLRRLTYEIQRLARDAGYELIVDQMEMEDLVAGRMPPMIQRRSVDGFFIYGRVRDFHTRFLDEQALPYILVGNRPVGPEVPQITISAEKLGYQITRMLHDMDRSPIWLDADPSNTDYEAGQAILRGYTRAMNELVGAPLHLCKLRMNRVDQAAEQLSQSDLRRAAFIVQDWAASLLMSPLQARNKDAVNLLLAPVPSQELTELLDGPNVIPWSRVTYMREMAEPALEQLLACIEGKKKRPWSVRLEMRCARTTIDGKPGFALEVKPRQIRPGGGKRRAAAPPTDAWMT